MTGAFKDEYWRNISGNTGTTIGGIGIFSLFTVCLLLLVNYIISDDRGVASPARIDAALGQSSPARRSFLGFITGRYHDTSKTLVTWGWDDPIVVGKPLTFTLHFFMRNSGKYEVTEDFNLQVTIENQNTGDIVTPSIQLGGDSEEASNSATVSFLTYKSGTYKITVTVASYNIRNSPFYKRFLPGPLDAAHSAVVNHTSIVVSTEGELKALNIEPRDQWDNQCSIFPCSETHDSHFNLSLIDSNGVECSGQAVIRVYELASGRASLSIQVPRAGVFKARATYGSSALKNAQFTLLVLTREQAACVQHNVAKKNHNVYYESRLLYYHNERRSKPRKVYCYLSPKQLTVKEFYLKFIPKRLFTFRVCPSTKLYFLGTDEEFTAPVLSIDDGYQAPVQLAITDRNLLAATFSCFLLANIGGSETFKDKQSFFYRELLEHHKRKSRDEIYLEIQRDNFLESSLRATKNFSTSDWCRVFNIKYTGERGLDWGGLRREWTELICTELFDPKKSGLYASFKDEDAQALVFPNPHHPEKYRLKHYEFAGRVVGKCLLESAHGATYRQLVKARFCRSFLAHIIGLRVNYKYFEHDDRDLFVTKIKYILENDVDFMDLFFTEDEYRNGAHWKTVDLIPYGSREAVTNGNKVQYLDALAQYKLGTRAKDEIQAFLTGLNELVPDNLLGFFDENELELLMCGTGTFSVKDFKSHHHVISLRSIEFNKTMSLFWTLVESFTQEQFARLLQFTTGCSQLPPGGFSELSPTFQISQSHGHNRLPSAHTCFNELCLSTYDSLEVFHARLHTAINEGCQGFEMA